MILQSLAMRTSKGFEESELQKLGSCCRLLNIKVFNYFLQFRKESLGLFVLQGVTLIIRMNILAVIGALFLLPLVSETGFLLIRTNSG